MLPITPLTISLQFIGGLVFGVVLVWATYRLTTLRTSSVAYGLTIFLLLVIADLTYVMFRLIGLWLVGGTDSVMAILVGNIHWLMFAIGAGLSSGALRGRTQWT